MTGKKVTRHPTQLELSWVPRISPATEQRIEITRRIRRSGGSVRVVGTPYNCYLIKDFETQWQDLGEEQRGRIIAAYIRMIGTRESYNLRSGASL